MAAANPVTPDLESGAPAPIYSPEVAPASKGYRTVYNDKGENIGIDTYNMGDELDAPAPVVVQFPPTATHPNGPRVSFADEATAQKHSASVWSQLKSAVQPYAESLGQELAGAGSEVARAAKGLATTVFPGQQQLLDSISAVHPVYQAFQKGGLAAANDAAKKQADTHDMLKQRIQEFHDNPSVATGRLIADAAMFALPYSGSVPEVPAAGETEAAATRESAMPPRSNASASANLSTEQAQARIQKLMQDAKRADAAAASAKLRGAGEVAPVSVPKMIKPVEPDVEVIAHQNLTEAPQKPTSQTMEHVGDKPRTSEELQKTAGEFLQKQVKPGESRVTAETVEPKEATTATQAEIDEAANKEISKLKKSPSGKPNVSFETHEGQFINRHRASINIGKAGEVGHVQAVSDPANPDAWRINSVDLDSEFRGKGLGVQAYEKLAKEAEKAGVSKLESGGSVSPEAQNVWGALKRRGYTVQKIGTAENPQFVLHLEPKVKPTANLTNEWQQHARSILAGEQ